VDFIASKAVEVEIETVPFERSTENTKLESIVNRDSEYQNTLHYCQWAGCKLPFKEPYLLENHERQVHSGMYFIFEHLLVLFNQTVALVTQPQTRN